MNEPKIFLKRMGYRSLNPEKIVWAKPFGQTLLSATINDDECTLCQMFQAVNGSVAVQARKTIPIMDFKIDDIKFFETCISSLHRKDFSFLSADEYADELLDGVL